MSEAKSLKQLDRFVDKGGDVVTLTEALVKALMKSGVLGKNEETVSDDAAEEIPTPPTSTVN